MDRSTNNTGHQIADIIGQRAGTGTNELVAGWQRMLTGLLENMAPYLAAGRLVTFRTLLSDEQRFFQRLHEKIIVPQNVTALYMSPSVRHQMMYGHPTGGGEEKKPYHPEDRPDDGILLACRAQNYQTIVNVLFAHPPHTPAIDVYDSGALIAGYSYGTIRSCRDEIATVLRTHLPELKS